MGELIKKLNDQINMNEEVDQIQQDLTDFDEWANQVENALVKYKPCFKLFHDRVPQGMDTEGGAEDDDDDENNLIKKHRADIHHEINRLKGMMMEVKLRNENTEHQLKLLEWLFFSTLFVNGLKKEIGLNEWKKLIRNGEKFDPEYDNAIPNILKHLQDEVKRAEKIEKFIESLDKLERAGADKISYRELTNMVD